MSVVETPSKAAASALSVMDLNTATAKKEAGAPTMLEKLKAAAGAEVTKPVVEQTKEEELEEYRKRFVGDLDCEEKDEPLLQESNARFVLFPIKYREVSFQDTHSWMMDTTDNFRSGKCTSRPKLRKSSSRH